MKNLGLPFSILHSPFSIYLHIPFCPNLCSHCHFYRVGEVPPWQEYLGAVAREIAGLVGGNEGPVHTLYVGGGTPTVFPPDFYRGLFDLLGDAFDVSGLSESTIETDGALPSDTLAAYFQAGFDRVSVGVKSFVPRVRRLLGAGPLGNPDPVQAARSAGFGSVSLDLVYGVQGQGLEEFTADLDQALQLAPDHVSLYALEGRYGKGPAPCEQDLAAAMFKESARILRAAGFRHYEITNFARPGHRSLHNTVYWQDGDYLGLGPAAHSARTRDGVRVRWRNLPDVAAYTEDPSGTREELSREVGDARASEALILALRMTQGVDRGLFRRKYGADPLDLLGEHLPLLEDQGLVRYTARKVRLTTRGMLLGNEVFLRILEDG